MLCFMLQPFSTLYKNTCNPLLRKLGGQQILFKCSEEKKVFEIPSVFLKAEGVPQPCKCGKTCMRSSKHKVCQPYNTCHI